MTDRIHALDWATADFTADCVGRYEAGAHGAAADIVRLHRMADATAKFLAELAAIAKELEVAVDPAWPHSPPAEIRDVIGEAIADQFRLTPSAARVFTAGLEAARR